MSDLALYLVWADVAVVVAALVILSLLRLRRVFHGSERIHPSRHSVPPV